MPVVKRLLRTPEFRMSFATLVEPKAYMENGRAKGEPEYSVEMLFDPAVMDKFHVRADGDWETDQKLANVLGAMAKEAWGSDFDLKEAVKYGGLKWPIVDGDKKAEEAEARGKKAEAYRGMKVVRAKAKQGYPPRLFVVKSGKIVELDREANAGEVKSKFVSGFYSVANINLVAQETAQGKYLTFYMNAVVMKREGERIGGMSAEDMFGGIVGGQSDHDPTEGLDDDIPF